VRNSIKTITGIFFLAASSSAWSDNFESKFDHFWAETPQGKFECTNDRSTDNLQVLKLNGKVIFQQKPGDETQFSDLEHGIPMSDVRCPDIVANQNGYVIIEYIVQPPWYGLGEYAAINFNDKPATLIELVEASRQDEKIPGASRVVWDKTGFTLTYVGYKIGEYGGSVDSPKPKKLKVRLDFADDNVTQVK
jgi:hypothetical protein